MKLAERFATFRYYCLMHVYELKSAAALVTGESGFWKANYNFFYRKIFCQLVNGSFLLPGMRFYGSPPL